MQRNTSTFPSLALQLAALEWRRAAALPPPGLLATGSRPKWFSDLEPSRGEREEFVYVGPFSAAVKRVKMLSLFSCACSVGAGPIILALDTSTSVSAKLGIATTLGAFGVFTTGLLHWFASPYVHKLTYSPKDDSAEVATLSMFARPKQRRFSLAEVCPPDTVHPLSTFALRDGRYYYLDLDHFSNKELLARLAPEAAAAHLMAVQPGAAAEALAPGHERRGDVHPQGVAQSKREVA